MTVYGRAIGSPLTDCQVTSRSSDRFSRYSKWLDNFRTGLVATLDSLQIKQGWAKNISFFWTVNSRLFKKLTLYGNLPFIKIFKTFTNGFYPATNKSSDIRSTYINTIYFQYFQHKRQ